MASDLTAIVVGMDQGGRVRTRTPPEPVVAHMAASLLMGATSKSGEPMMWKRGIKQSVDTLLDTLLAGSMAIKGLKGEIYARIIFLTQNYLLWTNSFRT